VTELLQAPDVEEPWRRLSVRMLLVHPVMAIIRFIPPILALVIVGTTQGEGGGWYALIGVGLGVVAGLLRWATTRYRVTDAQVEVRRGLFSRSVLTAPRDRIRSVDLTSHFMHRLLGLTRVAIGTGQAAGRRDSGLLLDGLSKQDGIRLRAELLRRPAPTTTATAAAIPGHPTPDGVADGAPDGAADQPADQTVAVLDPAWLRYAPFTLSGLVTIGVVAAFAWRTASEAQLDPNRIGLVQDAVGQLNGLPIGLAVLEVVATLVITIAVFSTVGYLLAFWNFKLTRSPYGTLHVARGLVTTRSTTIEERRLRGVEYSEPLLLRLVGAARVNAITTGLRSARGERFSSTLLPPAPAAEARRVSTDVLGDAVPVTAELARHPRAALRRRITRVLIAWLVLVAASGAMFWRLDHPTWTVGLAVGLLLPLLALGWERYRSLGHTIVDGLVIFRQGALVRRRVMIEGDGVVGWTISQSVFQRGSGLVTLSATTAAGRQRYALPDVDGATAVAIADRVLPSLLTPFLNAPVPRPRLLRPGPPADPGPDPRPSGSTRSPS
jgi:putative membrane protein